jgi:glycosyltransferase involved in cell wall biosynthesis
MDRLEERPLVSCHIITYNQKDYISKCIEGALMQETSFPYEIVIGDDCSTDGTREILLEYEKKYPEKIKLNLRKKRGKGIPGQDNFFTTMFACSGKFIALCDGDDYWIERHKLQIQVDFLQTNSNFSFCAHRTYERYETSGEEKAAFSHFFTENQDKIITKDNYLSEFVLNSNSIMFRSELINFKTLNRKGFKDIYLYTLLVHKGPGYCLPRFMGVYRINSNGIWAPGDDFYKTNANLNTLRALHQTEATNNEVYQFYKNSLRSLLFNHPNRLTILHKFKIKLELRTIRHRTLSIRHKLILKSLNLFYV